MTEKLKIVVADDDQLLLETVHTILEDAGHTVETATNGAIALDKIAATYPDIFITDIVMPEKEGIETIREIRRIYPGLKIIAMSGSGHQTDQYLKNARTFGAEDILPKPFSREQLLSTINSVMSNP